MKTILSMARDLYEDKSGASFIEYTVLLGVILAVSVAVVSTLGDSAKNVWDELKTQLDAALT